MSESIELINCIILSVKFALSASSVFSYLLTIQPDNVVLVLHKSSPNFDLAAFAKKTFGMYGGVDAEVTLECRNELAGVVIDRFGHDVWMCPHGEDRFRARVPVAVSSQFFGWITGIGSGMRIVGPEDVRQQYKGYLQNAIQNYMD